MKIRRRYRCESRLQITNSTTSGNLNPIVLATDTIGSCPCAYNKHHNTQVCRGMKYYLHALLTSVDGSEWCASCTGAFFYVALHPNAGYDHLIHEVFEITHTTRHRW
jgi:hypothetical protein